MSRLSLPLLRFKLRRVIPFALFAGAAGALYSILELGLLGLGSTEYPSTGNPYAWPQSLCGASASGLLVGSFLGLVEVTMLNRLLNRFSFGVKVMLKTVIYIILIALVITLTSLANFSVNTGAPYADAAGWQSIADFIGNWAFWSIMIYVIIMIALFLLIAELSENLGTRVFWNYLIGRYHKPREEQRIFMFLDMNDSTTIAEDLGHIRYFELVNEYYADMTNPIIESGGEIYQYVGDEIVISWPVRDTEKNRRCLACFQGITEIFQARADHFRSRYGVVPGFKAGLHCGKITTGEIGVLRKDILYTGDVLNTTSRIQGLCKTYGKSLLVSGELKEILGSIQELVLTSVGTRQVRGREEPVELFAPDF